jgi:hypothetical protein
MMPWSSPLLLAFALAAPAEPQPTKLWAIELSPDGTSGAVMLEPPALGEPAPTFRFGRAPCGSSKLSATVLDGLLHALHHGRRVSLSGRAAKASDGAAVTCLDRVVLFGPDVP